ncbi:MAG: Rrf2 family transcriptional regulator [Oscillospiraceae bacterium]|nr:Rrf2 family transcriptional regulator [Oscillospiraceae bacterium]
MHISAKCSVAVHCLLFIAEYGESNKVTSELLSRSTGINPVTIRNILSALKKDGIISIKPGTGGAALACPPEGVSLYRICQTIEPDFLSKLFGVHSAPSHFCPIGQNIHQVLDASYQKVKDEFSNSLRSITLADMIAEYYSAAQRKPI